MVGVGVKLQAQNRLRPQDVSSAALKSKVSRWIRRKKRERGERAVTHKELRLRPRDAAPSLLSQNVTL